MLFGETPSIVLALEVANQPRSSGTGVANNVFPTFRSGDVATFVLPQQSTVLMGALLTGYYRFRDNNDKPLSTNGDYGQITYSVNSGTVNFNPKCGHLGLFSSVTALRYLASQKIDQALTLALSSFIRSSARYHDDAFVNGSIGTGLYPYFQDASIDPSNLLPLDAVSSWKNFNFSIPLGSFQAGKEIDLNVAQGLQWDFQIARSYDGCHFAFSDKQYTKSAYPVSIYNFGNITVGTGISAFNIYNAGTIVDQSQNQYSLEVFLRMYIFLKPSNPASPAPDVFPFVTYNIRRTAMNVGNNQYFGFPLANNIISRFYWIAINKDNVLINPEIGQCHSSAVSFTDLRVLLNGSFQIYAYPTAGLPLGIQSTFNAPNPLVYSNLIHDPELFAFSQAGGMQEYIYDSQGNGQVFADVIVNYQWTLKQRSKGASKYCTDNNVAYDIPFNPYTAGTSMIQSSSFEDLFAILTCTSNTQRGTISPYNRAPADISWLQSPLYKYLPTTKSGPNIDSTVITKEVKTLIVDATASTVISAATIPDSLPSVLKFNQCAGTSQVFRVQEVSIAGTVVPSLTPNTITLRFLLPSSGTLGKMYLRFLPRWATDLYVPRGKGYYTGVATTPSTFGLYGSNRGSNIIPTLTQGDTAFAVTGLATNAPLVSVNDTFATIPGTFTAISTAGLNTISYHDALGTRTWLRALRWILPLSLQLQFPYVKEDYLLKYYGVNSKPSAIKNYYTEHMSDTYFTFPTSEGMLVDFPHRQTCSVIPQQLSMFPYFVSSWIGPNYAKELRDFPTSILPLCCIACNELHESFKNMERIVLSSEKQYIEFDLDTRLLDVGNNDCGLGYGLTNSGDSMRWRLGLFQQPLRRYDTSLNDVNSPILPGFTGFRRRQTFHWSLDPLYPPTLLVQLVYMDGITMERLLRDMETTGVTQDYLTFDYQLRRLEVKGDPLYPSFPESGLNEIDSNTILNIAGRNPTHIFIAHHPLLLRNNEYVMTDNDPLVEESRSTVFHKCKDLGIFPGYIGRRGGPLMTSLPSAVHDYSLFSNSQQLVQTFNPTIDGSPLNPFNLGNNETNMIMYALSNGSPMLQPANIVEVNAVRRIKYFEMDPPLLGAIANPWSTLAAVNQVIQCSPYNVLYANALRLGLSLQVQLFDQGGPLAAYQYRGASLLPSRFIVPINIPAPFWNGAVLQVNATPFPDTRIRWNYSLGGVRNDEYPNPNFADLFSSGARYNPYYNCHFMIRKYAFAQRLSLFLTTKTAQLKFDYPSGGTIVA
jgi:hypothetical protein